MVPLIFPISGHYTTYDLNDYAQVNDPTYLDTDKIKEKKITVLPTSYDTYYDKNGEYMNEEKKITVLSTSYDTSYDKNWEYMNEMINDLVTYYKKMVSKIVDKNSSLILPAGWVTHDDYHRFGGHLIGLYYEKLDDFDEQYAIIFFNSGHGINKHKRNNDGRYSVAKSYRVTTKNELVRIITNVMIMEFKIIYNNMSDSEIDFDIAELFYYRIFSESDVYVDDALDKMQWIEEQLSGSCTFFGYFYLIKYLFYRSGLVAEFASYESFLKEKCTKLLMDHIAKLDVIDDYHKNYLDLIRQSNVNFDQKLWTSLMTKYVTNVEYCAHIYTKVFPSSINLIELSLEQGNTSAYELIRLSADLERVLIT